VAADFRLLAATGMLGTGFPGESFDRGLELKPDMIGVDAGSTDSGPFDLATGHCRYGEGAYRRDLGILLPAALKAGIPLVIGSAGGAGGDANVDWTRTIIEDIARAQGLHFRLGVIYSGQDKAYLKRRLAEGRIQVLPSGPPIDEAVIDRSLVIVGMMGCEPIQAAITAGAQVVLAGRSSDTSVFAAIPLMRGVAAGPVWHAAKILECGAAAVEYRPSPDSMFATISGDSFVVEAPNQKLRCTPVSVAAHSLYENGDPFRIIEPAGTLDTTHSRYDAIGDRAVRVTGSRFEKAERYTIKLEGAELAGYQTIVVAGIRDATVLDELDAYLDSCRTNIEIRVKRTHPALAPTEWSLNYRVYGRNGTMGALEPNREIGHEVGVLIEATARDQKTANSIASIARHQTLHEPVKRWAGLVSNIGLPYGSSDLVRGAVYHFNTHAVVQPDSPMEMFRCATVDI
jgi:hypothetical protein